MRGGATGARDFSYPTMAVHSTKEQIATLRETGYVVVPGLIDARRLDALRREGEAQLHASIAPLEYEADLRYPGAPVSRDAAGGQTVRRLLDAFTRSQLFARWGTTPEIGDFMASCFGEPAILSRAHHNCLMTKHPRYGSLTGWHRDARYWSFRKNDLVSVWLALGPENARNGGLWFVPFSHKAVFQADRFDESKFFRTDREDNAALLRTAVCPELAAGDVVFFHCNTLHSAGRNNDDAVKYSLVFTYHGASNAPLPGTRSAATPGVPMPDAASG
jgi:phytanoyl-CoA hydroxylase